MSAIDIETLLAEISTDEPSGPDLEYDAAFSELERSAEGTPERQVGDSILPAEEPDWKSVKKLGVELLSRSKDLRIALLLSRALLSLDGLPGFRDGLLLLGGLVERYWPTVHPQLDPDDDNDPTMRVNILASLCAQDGILRELWYAPLVSSRALGRFSLRDLAIASGEVSAAEGDEAPPTMSAIDAAFMDADVESLQETSTALQQSIEQVRAMEEFVTEQVGTGNAASLAEVVKRLDEARVVVDDRLARRGAAVEGEGDVAGEAGGEPGGEGAASKARISGEIGSREDVIRTLDKVIQYYMRQEPSSPVPILVERAKRLATMDFLEIIKNLAPDGMTQVELIRGPGGQPEAEQQDESW